MRANGFTLIELLVAMTAGALLLASLSWAISRLNRDVLQMKRGSSTRQLLTVSDRLATLISGARAGPNDQITLTDRNLSFVTNPPLSLGAIGLVNAELNVAGRRGDQSLELSLKDDLGRTVGPARPSVLLSRQQEVRFAWADDNAAQEKVVAIHVEDPQGEPHDIVIALRITGDGACQFDPISMACR